MMDMTMLCCDARLTDLPVRDRMEESHVVKIV